jgi:hypothetical protein
MNGCSDSISDKPVKPPHEIERIGKRQATFEDLSEFGE